MNIKINDFFNELKLNFNKYTTEETALREFSRIDVFPLFDATRHDDFNRYLLWEKPNSIEDCLIQTEKLIKQSKLKNLIIISIIEKTTGRWLGMLKISELNFDPKKVNYIDDKKTELNPREINVEMSVWMHPITWGKRENKIGAKLLKDIIFNNFSEKVNVFARLNVEHERIHRIIENEGLFKIGELESIHENEKRVKFNLYKTDKEQTNNKKDIIIKKYID